MEEWQVDELFALVTRAASYSQLPRSRLRRHPRPAERPLPERRVRRAAPAHRVGPRHRHRSAAAPAPSASPSPAAAPSPTAACSASSSSARRPAASASSTRRWSTSPASATSSPSAPPAGGSRTSPTTGCSSPPRPASPAGCRSGRATPSAGPPSSARPSARSPASSPPSPRRRRSTSVRERGLDANAATNLVTYLTEQREATQVVPNDTQIVVERFRDELGDWRLVVHSPYGTPVHAPWALAINARLRERFDVDGQAVASDDGIVIRIPDTDAEPPTGEVIVFEPEEIEQLVTQEVGGSALFASRFRECAARALLLPRRDPGRRSPLWQQRQRSAQLLEVASQYPAVPDRARGGPRVPPGRLRPARARHPARPRAAPRGHRRRRRHHPRPARSPAACSSATSPSSSTRATPPSPSAVPPRSPSTRACSPSCSAAPSCASCSTRRCSPRSRPSCSGSPPTVAPATPRRSPTCCASSARCRWRRSARASVDGADVEGWLASLDRTPSSSVRMAGDDRWTAIEDIGRLRDGLGVPVPVGTPDAFLELPEDPLGDLVSRYARSHGPFTTAEVAARLGLGEAVARQTLQRLAHRGRVLDGEFRPSGSGTEWCDAEVLRKLRRRSLARLRQEIEPVTHDAVARFLPAWQRVGGTLRGVDGVVAAIDQLAGLPGPGQRPRAAGPRRPGPRLRAVDARRAHRVRRGHLDRPRPAARQRRLGQPPPRRPGPPDPARGRGRRARRPPASRPRRARPRRRVVLPPARRPRRLDVPTPTSAPPCGSWSGRAWSPTTPWRRCGRSSAAAPRPTAPVVRRRGSAARPVAGCPCAPVRPRRPDGGRCCPTATATRRGAPTPAPSTCSSATASSPAARSSASGSRAGSPGSTRCSAPSRTPAAAAAATSSRASAPRSSAAPARSTGCAPSPSPTAPSPAPSRPSSRSPPPTPPTSSAPPSRGPSAGDAERTGHRPGRKAGALVVLVDGALTVYVERGGRTLLTWSEDLDVLTPAMAALADAARRGALGRLTVEKADGQALIGSGGETPDPARALRRRASWRHPRG